jgi:hypothetical protein
MVRVMMQKSAFTMPPPTGPAFPPGPYRFVDCEYFIIRYANEALDGVADTFAPGRVFRQPSPRRTGIFVRVIQRIPVKIRFAKSAAWPLRARTGRGCRDCSRERLMTAIALRSVYAGRPKRSRLNSGAQPSGAPHCKAQI